MSNVELVGPKMYPVKEVIQMAKVCRYLVLHSEHKDVFENWLNEMSDYGYSLVESQVERSSDDQTPWYYGIIERPPDTKD